MNFYSTQDFDLVYIHNNNNIMKIALTVKIGSFQQDCTFVLMKYKYNHFGLKPEHSPMCVCVYHKRPAILQLINRKRISRR